MILMAVATVLKFYIIGIIALHSTYQTTNTDFPITRYYFVCVTDLHLYSLLVLYSTLGYSKICSVIVYPITILAKKQFLNALFANG